MKRRDFIIGAGTAAAALAIASRAAYAAKGQIDWYTSSDQNILDFWTNVIKPKFEAANPGTTINLVDGGDSAGDIRFPLRRVSDDDHLIEERGACREREVSCRGCA